MQDGSHLNAYPRNQRPLTEEGAEAYAETASDVIAVPRRYQAGSATVFWCRTLVFWAFFKLFNT